jgi:hypothetical protein
MLVEAGHATQLSRYGTRAFGGHILWPEVIVRYDPWDAHLGHQIL